MASGIASLLRFGGVSLKPIAGCRHQIWNAGQVPVGVRNPGVSDIGRERDHRMVNICAVSLPELDPFANKRMPKIVDTGRGVVAAGDPAESRA